MKVLLAVCLGFAPFLLGCGGSEEGQVDVYPVSGKVTIAGAPLAGASIIFAPRDKQPAAMGRTDSQGNYALTTYDAEDGAAEGTYDVVITKVPPASASASSGGASGGHSSQNYGGHSAASVRQSSESLVPEQYGSSESTPLDANVNPDGENVFNFEL